MLNPKIDPVSRLIFQLSKLPGIGEKTATRLAYFILKQDISYSQALSEALLISKEKIRLCESCCSFTEVSPCQICCDSKRDLHQICIVEQPSDLFCLEQSGSYKGLYHVLHGTLSPMNGIGPDELKIQELFVRLKKIDQPITEVIFATNPSVEGDATTFYLSKLMKPFPIKLTQLAYGLPVGGVLEYTDRQTIGKALTNRTEIH